MESGPSQHFILEAALLWSAEFRHLHPLQGCMLSAWLFIFSAKPTIQTSVIHSEEVLPFENQTLTFTQKQAKGRGLVLKLLPCPVKMPSDTESKQAF